MKRFLKWLFGIIVVVIIALFCTTWYLSNNWKPIIESKLKEVILSSSDSLYTLKYTDMDINLSFGNISLDSVELIPDSAVYQKLVQSKKAPNNRYHITLNALRIKHFSITDIWLNRKLSISNIVLDGPKIHLLNEHQAYNDTVSTEPKKKLYDHIKGIFKSISVNKVSVADVDFSYSSIEGGQASNVISVGGVNLNVEDLLIDSLSLEDTSRVFYSKSIDVRLPKFEYILPNGFYKVGFDKLHINTKEKVLSLNDVFFKPTMNRARFFKLKGKNVAISDVKFSQIQLNGLDFDRLVNNQQVFGSTVNVSNGIAAFYQDLGYPFDLSSKIGTAPYQQMMKVKKAFHFNTVYVNNVTVSYSERSAKFNKEGVITFNNTHGTLTNVTNDIGLLQKNKFMRADLTTKVMNQGSLNVKFGFDMLSKNGAYTYAGTLSPMKASSFNRILEPLVSVQIPTGNIKKITFDMQGTDYKNWGIFKFDYDSLKVNILSLAKDGQTKGSKKALSYLVNKIFVSVSNPDPKGIYHVGLVEYTRVPEYPFFKTLWQSLLQGIVQCVGISPEQEAKLMGVAEKSGKVITEVKKIAKGTEKVAKAVGQEVGKDASKAFHGTENLFKKLFKKKHEE